MVEASYHGTGVGTGGVLAAWLAAMPKRPRSPRIDEDADADAITGLDLPPAAWTLSIEDLPASSSALATEEIGDGGVPAARHARSGTHDAWEDGELPLWMQRANATIIGSTPNLRVQSLRLDARLEAALHRMGVSRCFPVQASVVPLVLASQASGLCGDVCVCAPTGSGKTLAYALPVVQQLLPRVLPRLRALVLLPTRGLAAQVARVFEALVHDTPLRVGLAVGQEGSAFAREREALLGPPRGGADDDRGDPISAAGCPAATTVAGGRSAVDILVATPGRLVEHLRAGGGFTLQHLRWLVVDEADRLLSHGYQEWISAVLAAAYRAPRGDGADAPTASDAAPQTRRPWAASVETLARGPPTAGVRGRCEPLTKMLFSATLTRSPARLAALHLQRPRFFCVAGAKYATPATLREWMLVCSAPEKPMLLVLLLRWLRDGGSADACATAAGISDGEGGGTPAAGSGGVDGNDDGASQTLVFTSSVDATHRLTRLLQLFGFPDAVEYSGSLAHKQRRAVLGGMRSGALRLVVTSDAMARGIDVDTIGAVINYDPPAGIKAYVHRVGRTARAGRVGSSYTLLRDAEVHHFKASMAKAAKPWRPLLLPSQRRALRDLQPEYDAALAALQQSVQRRAPEALPLAAESVETRAGDGAGRDSAHVSK